MDEIEELLESFTLVQARLTSSLRMPIRPWRAAASLVDRGVIISGPRGVGKTSLLLRRAAAIGGRYLSLDHPAFAPFRIHTLVETLFQRGVTAVFLDEIHAARDWSAALKALYDTWPRSSIWASGSDSLLLTRGIGDLSRRYLGLRMPLLSFREYLVLRGLEDFGVHDPFDPDQAWTQALLVAQPVLALFEEYLRAGTRPFFAEGPDSFPTRLLQVVEKTLLADIPDLVPSISQNHFRLMNAILGYLARSPIPVIQVNSLCREWNLGKEKLYSLLHAMEQTGLLKAVRYATDHSVLSVGAKLFLADPALYPALEGKEGNMREAFAAVALEYGGHRVHASRDESSADYIIDGCIAIEVGGPRKKRKNARLVIRDGTDHPAPGILPLWMLGFGW